MKRSTTEKLNELLQGERAAAETYKQALSKFGSDPRSDGLREIQSDHFDAVLTLKKFIEFRDKNSEKKSGVWGTFAKTVMGSAKLFGDQAALKALIKGEEFGLSQYRKLVNDESVQPNVRNMMLTTMIPKQQNHIEKINHILKRTA